MEAEALLRLFTDKCSKQNIGPIGDFNLRLMAKAEVLESLENESYRKFFEMDDCLAQFNFFGTSSAGVFAFWKKAPIGEPVVYFGRKGLKKVAAPSLSVFLSLLADQRHSPVGDQHDHQHCDHGHDQHLKETDGPSIRALEFLREFLSEQKIAYPIIYRPTFNELKNERGLIALVDQ